MAKKICVHRGCNHTRALKKSKSGNWYCVTHHPNSKKKQKKRNSAGGKASVRVRRKKRLLAKLNINIKDNRQSVVNALIDQANFFGQQMDRDDNKRAKLVLEIMRMIHEYTTEGMGEEEQEKQIKEIISSELPDIVKLSNLSVMVGPAKAMKLVPIVIKRDGHDDETLDGNLLLKRMSQGGKMSISKPEALTFEESLNTEDVPPPQLSSVDEADPTAPPPPPEKPKPKETEDEKKARCFRQAKELLGLYKIKVSGNFRNANEVGKIFYYALLDKDMPFDKIQQRVLLPKSATDQPEMMVKDVLAAVPKPKETA